MKFSNREPPCARKRDSRWTNTNLKRHKAGAQTSGGRRLQVPQGYTYVELHRHAGEAFRGDRARGKRQTEATLPAALSGSESKAPGSAGGYLHQSSARSVGCGFALSMNGRNALIFAMASILQSRGPIAPPFYFNDANVSRHSPEMTGRIILNSMCARLGWPSLAGKRVLDFGCGVRMVRTIVNLELEIGFYAGIDVNAEAIAWLRQNVDDPWFLFV